MNTRNTKETYTMNNLTYFCENCFTIHTVSNPATIDVSVDNRDPNVKIVPHMRRCLEDSFMVTCPNCDCYMVPVDAQIAGILQTFNKKGYTTLFSCAGHPEEDPKDFHAYILFGIDPYRLKLKSRNYSKHRQAVIDYGNCIYESLEFARHRMLQEYKSHPDDFRTFTKYFSLTRNSFVDDDPRCVIELKSWEFTQEEINTDFKSTQNLLKAFYRDLEIIADLVSPMAPFDISEHCETASKPGKAFVTEILV